VVAVLDTGVDLSHTALATSLVAGRDMISDTATPDDIGPGLAWGHGTHVAGIVHRMAPASKILPIRVLDSQGRGNTFVLAYAIEYAVQQGADVINLSLGADCGSQVLSSTIQSAIAQGVVIVAAAGNSNTQVPQCPASMPGVIAVAAVDENKVRAEWSNYGAGWVDIAAPGVGITSTFPGGYASWSGTSMAAPFVSGAAALAKQKKEASNGDVPVDEMLIDRGSDISGLNSEAIGPLLDVAAAVDSLPTEPEPTPTPSPGGHNLFLPAIANP
ncbi:MAG: S8 family serine peptidase, partial [Caldilineaceae bacterium]|nr:S8 family serine peptidase [Caldilineaceae bacterium]